MEKKMVLELNNHNIYYIKNDLLSFYITVPKQFTNTSICIELKSKMNNFNLEINDEIWVMENVKNVFSFIDDYNITLVLPIIDEENISILEKVDQNNFEKIDKLIGYTINGAYNFLKECGKKIENKITIVDNDRYKTFINWFITKYKDRVECKNLIEIIQMYNVNATDYKKFETPAITFVVGSYNTEVNAPKNSKEEEEEISQSSNEKLIPQTSSGFSSYWLLAVITIVVSTIVAIIAFTMN